MELPQGWELTESHSGAFFAHTKQFSGVSVEGNTREQAIGAASSVDALFRGEEEKPTQGIRAVTADLPSG